MDNETIKICITCGEEKQLNMFPRYKNRKGEFAYFNSCKKCKAIYKHNHYVNNREVYLLRAKKFREDNHDSYLDYLHNYYRENKEPLLVKAKEYAKTHREQRNANGRKWRNSPENAIKNKAHSAVSHALRDGKLFRPSLCSACGKECIPEAHHTDYEKFLDVVWLCKQCHENIHHLNEGDNSLEVTTNKPLSLKGDC